jgi:membrane protein
MRRIFQIKEVPSPGDIWTFSVRIYNELLRTRSFVIAAALAFYFLLALVPLLLVFSSLLGSLSMPSVFVQLLNVIRSYMPPDAMAIVERALNGIRSASHGKVLSFGLLGYIWAASGGFSAMIESLDIAYDVQAHRPWVRDRGQAIVLTFTTGMLMILSLAAQMAGPRFGHFLQEWLLLPSIFSLIWPPLRLIVTFVTFVVAIEVLYFLGPNVKQRFSATFPGAVVAVTGWSAGSMGLNLYLNHLTSYNTTYGSLGALIGLMLWFYLVALAILVGAEVNAELLKGLRFRRGHLQAAERRKDKKNVA